VVVEEDKVQEEFCSSHNGTRWIRWRRRWSRKYWPWNIRKGPVFGGANSKSRTIMVVMEILLRKRNTLQVVEEVELLWCWSCCNTYCKGGHGGVGGEVSPFWLSPSATSFMDVGGGGGGAGSLLYLRSRRKWWRWSWRYSIGGGSATNAACQAGDY
jgi:hypothetical protein